MEAKGQAFSRLHSTSWVLLHSLVVVLCLTSLVTGLRIATQTRPEVLHFSALLPQGNMHGLHFFSAVGLLSIVIAYFLHLILFRESRSQIRRGASHYHQSVFWLGRALVLASLVSGVMLYVDRFAMATLVEIHYLAALAWVLYLLIHGGVYFVQYGWLTVKRIVISKQVHVRNDAAILVILLAAFGVMFTWTQSAARHELLVKLVSPKEQVRIDGIADETAWDGAEALTLNTIGGANFLNGQTRITIKALHNGTGAFFLVRWYDPSKSLQHLPLVKTEAGWKVTESGFYHFDETEYYEDKLALIISKNCSVAAAGTARLGPNPLKDKVPNWHGKGYHYAADGEVHDLWHWKAVRTNDMFVADDNLIGPPDIVRKGMRRYTAGYLTDPKESGGYVMNWQWYRQSGVVPRRMPQQPEALVPYQSGNGEDLSWSVPWYSYDLYDASSDVYPVGTIMPSVLYMSNRMEGDRADVYAHGRWADGQWTLEMMRRFDTNSGWDVKLESGVCLWVAAFDHAQVAHTRHMQPIQLTFESDDD
ncbi:MAG: ethylbenzene dehydrogenase-related protein [Xanthomonadales bacterium]|nr:ethylbenzene dehydrogenase-related protein [Xanthomonadales bacterium]